MKANNPTHTFQSLPHPTSASVPISVYRQVIEELEATHQELRQVEAKNERLVQHNRQLHTQIEKLMLSAESIQQLVQVISQEQQQTRLQSGNDSHCLANQVRNRWQSNCDRVGSVDYRTVTVESRGQFQVKSPERSKIISWWLMTLIILLVAVTAIGSGLFLIRPLLHNNNYR